MSSFVLKIIGLITMTIDHIGFVFGSKMPFDIYLMLRAIGRLAFPIFAFQFAVGFSKTQSKENLLKKLAKYAILFQLIIFAFAYVAKSFSTLWFNVFFTFLYAGIIIFGLEKYKIKNENKFSIQNICKNLVIIVVTTILSVITNNDYGIFGILLTIMFYYMQNHKYALSILYSIMIIAYSIFYITQGDFSHNHVSVLEFVAIFNIILFFNFNGKKGYSKSNFFYLYYPLHFGLLYVIKYLIFKAF